MFWARWFSLWAAVLLVVASGCEAPLPIAAAAVPPTSFENRVAPFLQAHCVRCHGADKQEAELRLDQLSADFAAPRAAERWWEVRNRLHQADMPPEDEPQPPLEERAAVVAWIDAQARAHAAAQASTEGQVVLRRLNRDEYRRTIRDLLGVEYRAAADLPEDAASHGFDNVGAALTVSPLHIEQYLQAARTVLAEALAVGPPPPKQGWHFELRDAIRGPADGYHDRFLSNGRRTYGWMSAGRLPLRDGFVVLRDVDWDRQVGFRLTPIPAAGEYIVRVHAAAIVPSREQAVAAGMARYEQKFAQEQAEAQDDAARQANRSRWDAWIWPDVKRHFADPSIYDYGPPRMRLVDHKQQVLAEIDVDAPPAAPRIYEFRLHFDAVEDGVMICNNYNVPTDVQNFWFVKDETFPRPELLIDWIELQGPLPSTRPPLLGDAAAHPNESDRAVAVLRQFLPRAFRRPVAADDVAVYLELFRGARAHCASFEEAMQTPLAAALVSSHFLFLVEPAREEGERRPLSDYEVASRLSYFLWSTMPDAELFELAAAGKLRDADLLRAQVERMLSDEKSSALVENFAGQWLGLRRVGKNPPTRGLFPQYDDHLEQSIVGESRAFFAEILRHDLDVANFLQSDFVTINERLARYYGIAGVRGDQLRRVSTPAGVMRGGVLTQASMLTVTSNGTRTSPVVRGAWILENLLGDPPPPPPPNVGDIAPKVPGIDKATVRDRLEAHRRLPQCASCHQKIDPLGLALENFNADGRWRDQVGFGYNGQVGPDDPPVDASGRLPNGRTFQNFAEFQQLLLADEERFLSCLTEKMLVYALGRTLDANDETLRTRLAGNLRQHRTLRSLIQEIAASEAFLTK